MNKNLLLLAFLGLLSLVSIVLHFTHGYVLDTFDYIGFGCISFTAIVCFFMNKYFVQALGFTLFIGAVGLLDFSILNLNFVFILHFNLIPLLFFTAFLIINKDIILPKGNLESENE